MILKKIKYVPFKTGLKKPFVSAGIIIKERKGFYLVVEDVYGNQFTGEVSPLPGLSRESLEEAERDIQFLVNSFQERKIDNDFYNDIDSIYDQPIVPSVRYGFEQALLNYLFSVERNSIQTVLHRSPNGLIPVNALVDLGDYEKVIRQSEELLKSGYKTIKIKVGRPDFEDDLRIIEFISKEIPGNPVLRLDANGSWDPDSAYENLKKLSDYNIQYVEDPCSHFECMLKVSKAVDVPVAPDSPIKTLDELRNVLELGQFNFIVVKPMITGSIFKLIDQIKFAEQMKINMIISSSFESTIGRSMLVLLSSLVHHSHAHGLSTLDNMEKSILPEYYPVKNGSIKFDCDTYPPHFKVL